MHDQDKEKPFDAEAYKQKLLSSSHGRVRRVSAKEAVLAYAPGKEEVDKLRSEEKERISRRLDPKNYMRL